MSRKTTCVIICGGPAGMIAGLILARAGVDVTILEKHGDFLRDFRGDTVHPTTLEVLDELGLIDQFNSIPHSKIHGLTVRTERGTPIHLVDISRLKIKYPYLAITPQWDFLNLLAAAGANEPTFRLVPNAEFTDLLYQRNQVVGARYKTQNDEHELHTDLTLAADGRWSQARAQARLPVRSAAVPIDLWWFRVNAPKRVAAAILPTSANGKVFIAIPRKGYVQMGNIISKGADGPLRAAGIQQLRLAVAKAVPEVAESAAALEWNDVKLLDIQLNRLQKWYTTGLLCIGDAAHAMSPVGGVGVNLAVQDGVAAASMLAKPLLDGTLSTPDLAAVQKRREGPAKFTQRLQKMLHRAIGPMVMNRQGIAIPAPLRWLVEVFPQVRKAPARLLLIGRKPEHVPHFARRTSGEAQ